MNSEAWLLFSVMNASWCVCSLNFELHKVVLGWAWAGIAAAWAIAFVLHVYAGNRRAR